MKIEIEFKTFWLSVFLAGWALGVTGCDDSESSAIVNAEIEADRGEGNAPFRVVFSVRTGLGTDIVDYSWNFGDGETSDEESPVHTFEDPGEYTVRLDFVDRDGANGSAETNINVVQSADLAIEDVIASPNRVKSGDELTVNWAIRNSGADVVGDWAQAIVLSQDRNVDVNDVVLGSKRGDIEFEDGRPAPQQLVLQMPENLESGDWHLAVVADFENQVGDADRTNNLRWAPAQIQVRNQTDTGPDLVICGLSIPAFDGLPPGVQPTTQLDDQLAIEVCLANQGNRPVGGAQFKIALSRDDTLDASDPTVALSQNVALGAGDRDTVEILLDIADPIGTGEWFVLVEADPSDSVNEQNETNNQRAWSEAIAVVEPGQVDGVDLVLRRLTVGLEQAYWGQELPTEIVVANRGTISVERFFVIRFLAEPIAGGTPILLHSLNVDGFASGDEQTLAVGVPINRALEQGEYVLYAHIDPTNSVDDVNEANNRRAVGESLELGGAPSVDPTVMAVTLGSLEVDAGNTLVVGADLRNLGTNASGVIQYAVVLSADDSVDASDVTVFSGEIANIEGGGTDSVDATVTIPQDVDQQVPDWMVAVIVDPSNRITGELNEENNVAFALERLTVNGATGGCAEDANEPNDRINQALLLEPGTYPNLGSCGNEDWFQVDVPAGEVFEVRLNEVDEGATPRLDILDGNGTVLATGVGVTENLKAFVMPDAEERILFVRVASDGARYQYALVIDVAESPAESDLRVTGGQVSPRFVQQGQNVAFQFQVANTGSLEAVASQAGIYLGIDADIRGASLLGTIPVAEVPAGGTVDVQGTVQIPLDAQDGDYIVAIQADSTQVVMEANEENNVEFLRIRLDQEQACAVDPFEPNGSPHEAGGAPAFAADLDMGDYQDLTACLGDDDWYAIQVGIGQRVSATVTYAQNQGDLELALYEPDGQTLVASSTSILGTELVEIPRSERAGTYLLRVYMQPGETVDNQYRLELVVEDAAACQEDPFEPDDPEGVPLLPDGLHDLRLCPNDSDQFRFAIPAGNTVSWQLTAGAAPLTMTLYAPDGQEVGSDDRRIAHQARQNGNYVLRIEAADDGEYAYQLRISGVSGVDLAVDSVQLSRGSVEPGSDLRIRSTVSNLRGDNARNVQIEFRLTPDANEPGTGVLLAERLLPLIEGAAQVNVDQRVTLPPRLDELPAFMNQPLPVDAFVVAILDPERTVPDLRPGNNVAAAALELRAACQDDDDRENEGPLTATRLEPGAAPLEGVVCAFTEDWFRLDNVPPGQVDIRLSFDNAAGDLDLQVLNADTGVEIGVSQTEDDVELVRFILALETSILIRVDGFDEAANHYSLQWDLP